MTLNLLIMGRSNLSLESCAENCKVMARSAGGGRMAYTRPLSLARLKVAIGQLPFTSPSTRYRDAN